MHHIKRNHMMNRKPLLSFATGCALTALAGCGGNDGSHVEPMGGQFSAGSGSTSVVALITEAGNGWLADTPDNLGFAFTLDTPSAGSPDANPLTLNGTVVEYDGTSGKAISSGTAQASLQRGSLIALVFTLANGKSGSYSLPYLSYPYEQPSSLSILAGAYAAPVGSTTGATQIVALNVDASGNVTASDSAGCTYSGTVAAVNPSYNAYQFNALTQSCADGSSVTGLSGQAIVIPAVIRPGGTQPPQLTLFISNAAQQSGVVLSR